MPFEPRSFRDKCAIGKSPPLLWARTWQKQGRIQFIRRPLRVNPADVVNAAAAVRSRISPAKCPMLLQKSLSYSRKRVSGRLSVSVPSRDSRTPANRMCPRDRHDCPKDLEKDLAPDRAMGRWRRFPHRCRCPMDRTEVAADLTGRRPLQPIVRLDIGRQGQGPGIVSAGEFHQRPHPGIRPMDGSRTGR